MPEYPSSDPADTEDDESFHQILSGIDIDLGGNAGAYGVRHPGAQGAYVENVQINAVGAFAAYPSRIFGAALCEELMFRAFGLGCLLLLGMRPVWATLLISTLFTAGHLRYAAEGRWGFLGMMLLGSLVWGWLTLRTKNIATTTVLHSFENSPNLFVV